MKVPFILRLKWIRLKCRLKALVANDQVRAVRPGWLILLGIIGLGLAWIIAGCTPAGMPRLATAVEEETAENVVPTATVRTIESDPTPAPTSIPSPTSTPVNPWEGFLAPVEPSAIEIRRPVRPHENNDQLITFVLLGSDQRPGEYGHRSDVIMLLCIDPAANTVRVLSIPRDLYLYIPGWRVDRINVADGRGGPGMVADTILYNFGLEVDHWVRVDFAGFVRAVDSLGGIDVEVSRHLSDFCGQQWSYSPGVHRMNGFQALCYVRMRKASSDFDRLRREQEVAHALFKRVVSLEGLARLPEFVEQYQGMVETDVRLDDLLPLLPIAVGASKEPGRIQSFAIGLDMSTPWRVPGSGASVVLPDWTLIGSMLEDSFGLPEQSWQ